ncbi:MAG: right-handed parallel beta-helix repeat-containing protein, partial [Planctomycetota bacterium]
MEDGFRVERSTDGENFAFLVNKDPNSAGHEDTNLDSATTYTYRVCARDTTDGNSVWSNEASDSPLPSAPTNVTATAVNGSIKIEWDLSSESDVNDYKVYRDTVSDFSLHPVKLVAAVEDANVYTDSSADANITYYYKVTSVDNLSNESAASAAYSASIAPRVHNVTKDIWYYFIQDAIDAASSGNVIVATQATYVENIDFGGKAITVQSTDPADWSVVTATIIDANGGSYGVYFSNGEDADSILDGLTVKNGNYGIRCVLSSNPTLKRCIVKENTFGICAWTTAVPIIENNRVFDNSTHGIMTVGAYAREITNNWVYNNGRGRYLLNPDTDTIVRNNTIVGNEIAGILAITSDPTIISCIVWDCNDDLSGCTAEYSCIQDGDTGTGNISSDPCFVAPDTNDFHIGPNSPCINYGDPNYLAEAGETDIDGDRRIMAELIDIGADEFGRVIYVDANAPGSTCDGTSWGTAFLYLQDGLADANKGDEIRVADGNYYPDQGTGHTPDDRSETFELLTDVAIYGGYAGYGAAEPNECNWVDYETVLSGDIDGNDVNDGLAVGDNSYHVVTGANVAFLNGVTITGGDTTGASDANGAAIYCDGVSPTISNCIIILNKAAKCGAGMYNTNGAEPLLINCLFCGNWSKRAGAEIYNKADSNAVLGNCTISANKAL